MNSLIRLRIVVLIIYITISGCNGLYRLKEGSLNDNKIFRYGKIKYFGNHCESYGVSILNNKKRIESIEYYTCSPLPPIKIIPEYINNKVKNYKFYVAATDNNYTVPITNDEKELFKILTDLNSKKQSNTNYKNYLQITGFRESTANDNAFANPVIRKMTKRIKSD